MSKHVFTLTGLDAAIYRVFDRVLWTDGGRAVFPKNGAYWAHLFAEKVSVVGNTIDIDVLEFGRFTMCYQEWTNGDVGPYAGMELTDKIYDAVKSFLWSVYDGTTPDYPAVLHALCVMMCADDEDQLADMFDIDLDEESIEAVMDVSPKMELCATMLDGLVSKDMIGGLLKSDDKNARELGVLLMGRLDKSPAAVV